MILVFALFAVLILTVVVSVLTEIFDNRTLSVATAAGTLWLTTGLMTKNFLLYLTEMGGTYEPSQFGLVLQGGLLMSPVWAPMLALVKYLLWREGR